MLRNSARFLLGVAIASLFVLLPAVQSSSADNDGVSPACRNNSIAPRQASW